MRLLHITGLQWEMFQFTIEVSYNFIGLAYCILLCSFHITHIQYLLLVGTHVIGTDPHCDPFCIWGNDIILKHGQVKKIKKIVRRNRKKMNIKLFVCALSKTTVNFRMVRTRLVALIFPIHNVYKFVSTTNSELLRFSVVFKAVHPGLALKLCN